MILIMWLFYLPSTPQKSKSLYLFSTYFAAVHRIDPCGIVGQLFFFAQKDTSLDFQVFYFESTCFTEIKEAVQRKQYGIHAGRRIGIQQVFFIFQHFHFYSTLHCQTMRQRLLRHAHICPRLLCFFPHGSGVPQIFACDFFHCRTTPFYFLSLYFTINTAICF